MIENSPLPTYCSSTLWYCEPVTESAFVPTFAAVQVRPELFEHRRVRRPTN